MVFSFSAKSEYNGVFMLKFKMLSVLLFAILVFSLVEKAEATSLAEPIGEKATNASVFLVSSEGPLWSAAGLGSFQAVADRGRPRPRPVPGNRPTRPRPEPRPRPRPEPEARPRPEPGPTDPPPINCRRGYEIVKNRNRDGSYSYKCREIPRTTGLETCQKVWVDRKTGKKVGTNCHR
jgi:hypothetical protein